jgi:hypothetical protein
MKGIKIDPSTYLLGTETVANLMDASNHPVRLFEACTSNNVAGQDETHHWSGICSCGDKMDYEPNYAVQVSAPREETPYFWGFTQKDKTGAPVYYFNGALANTNLGTVADKMLESTPIYVKTVEGGYVLYFKGKEDANQYIWYGTNATNSAKHFEFVADVAAATIFGWNREHNGFTVMVDGTDLMLGGYSATNTDGSVGTAYTKITGFSMARFDHAVNKDHSFAAKLYVKHMTHAYDGWGYDAQNHWKECLCGKKQEEAAHTLGDLFVEDGKVVRKCDCGYTAQEGTVPTIDGYSISLKDNFAINFFVKKADFEGSYYKDPYMVFVMKEQETKVTEYTTRGDYYVFTFGNLAPDLMQQTITANLYATVAAEVALVDTGAYSVAQYACGALLALSVLCYVIGKCKKERSAK